MRLGLTYDLRQDYLDMGFGLEETAEFDKADTIDVIEATLRDLGFQPERIGNAYALTKALAQGRRWDMVFNIAEGVRGFGREALIPALLDAYGVPYVFSEPLALAVTLHKGVAKRVVRDQGVPTPDFAVVERIEDIPEVTLGYPVFAKPVAEGTGKGVGPASRADSRQELAEVCARLLAKHRQPVLVEAYLPGREFTVGVAGTGRAAEVLGVMEVVLQDSAEQGAYTYANKEDWRGRVVYSLSLGDLALEVAEVALAAFRALGVRDCGRVDIRLDAQGKPCFLEVNPLPGLLPGHSDLPILCELAGTSFRELLDMVMRSAMARARAEAPGLTRLRQALGS